MNSLPKNMGRFTVFRPSGRTHTFVFQNGYVLPASDQIRMQINSGPLPLNENAASISVNGQRVTIVYTPETLSLIPELVDHYLFLGDQAIVGGQLYNTVEYGEPEPTETEIFIEGELVTAIEIPGLEAIQGQVADRLPFKTISGLRLDSSVTAVYVDEGRKSGTFFYDPEDTTSVDDGVMVIVSGTRRYKRQYSGTPDAGWWMVADYNYATNSGTDNGPLLQAAIAWKYANGGGDLRVPIGRYFFATDVYVNELAIPLKLVGANGYNRNYSANRVLGTSFIRNAPGNMFKINHNPDDSIYLQPDEQYPSFHVEGINFQCKNGYVGGVNVFRGLRFRGKFINCSCDGFDYFMYQPNADINGVDNYCDQSTYQDISISGSTLGGIRVFRADGTLLDRISFEGSATQYRYGIEVVATTGAMINRPLFWTPDDPASPIENSSFISLVACKGILVLAAHVERSFFTHVVYAESCVGVSIIGMETKFSRYNGLTVTGTSYGVAIRDWDSNDTVKAGYYDINVPGATDRQITYDNCMFLTAEGGTERAINVNAPTRTTVRVPAYVKTYQGSTDASITLTRAWMAMFLGAITANRTLTVPAVAQSNNGDEITIVNRNTTSFRWLVGNTVLDADGTTLTYFENNKTYELIFANGQWRVKTKYPELTTLVSTHSGNGSATTFNIPHGMSAAPGFFSVTPASSAAAGTMWVTADAVNIVVRYVAAPANGVNNLVFNVAYKK